MNGSFAIAHDEWRRDEDRRPPTGRLRLWRKVGVGIDGVRLRTPASSSDQDNKSTLGGLEPSA